MANFCIIYTFQPIKFTCTSQDNEAISGRNLNQWIFCLYLAFKTTILIYVIFCSPYEHSKNFMIIVNLQSRQGKTYTCCQEVVGHILPQGIISATLKKGFEICRSRQWIWFSCLEHTTFNSFQYYYKIKKKCYFNSFQNCNLIFNDETVTLPGRPNPTHHWNFNAIPTPSPPHPGWQKWPLPLADIYVLYVVWPDCA